MEKIKGKITKDNIFMIYVISIALSVLTITLIRAATTAITWDEAYTYVEYSRNFNINQFINIHSNFANNHILNTIFIAILDTLCNLPYNEFIIRLPNIIMLVFYFIGSYMVSKTKKHKYLVFTGLVLNYYVIEYFGLGRGYGISTAFVVFMCYFFEKAHKNDYDDKNIFISAIFGMLACYANTVSILALFTIAIIYLVQIIKKKDLVDFLKRNIMKLIPLVILLVYIVIFHFIVTGSDKPVFGEEYGNTITGFMKKSFVWMFVENEAINMIVTSIGIVFIAISTYIHKKKLKNSPFFIALLVMIVVLIVPSLILKKPFLIERCLNPLWPIFVLGMMEIYTLWTETIKNKAKEIVISAVIILALIFAFVIRIDTTSTRNWANNYEIKEIMYRALVENRSLTEEEYVENKDYFGMTFYQNKIFEKYGVDVLRENIK